MYFQLVRTGHWARWMYVNGDRNTPPDTFSKRCMSWLGGLGPICTQQITTSQDIMNCCGAPPMNASGKQDRHTWRREKKNLQLTLCNHSVSTISTERVLDFGHFGSFLSKQQQSGDSQGACSLGGKACRTASCHGLLLRLQTWMVLSCSAHYKLHGGRSIHSTLIESTESERLMILNDGPVQTISQCSGNLFLESMLRVLLQDYSHSWFKMLSCWLMSMQGFWTENVHD